VLRPTRRCDKAATSDRGITFLDKGELDAKKRRKQMKRYLKYFLVLSFIFTPACAGYTVDKELLKNNVFRTSQAPGIKIKIGPSFKYLGKHKQSSVDPGLSSQLYNYIFVEGDTTIDKCIIISVKTLFTGEWVHSRHMFEGWKDKIDSGYTAIKGKEYHYGIGVFRQKEMMMLQNKGYRGSSYGYLVKGLGRVPKSLHRGSMVAIFYAEDIGHLRGNWRHLSSLTNEQKKFLEEFKARSTRNVQILGWD
jgi:hypothetical protein